MSAPEITTVLCDECGRPTWERWTRPEEANAVTRCRCCVGWRAVGGER